MRPRVYQSFSEVAEALRVELLAAPAVRTERWQGVDVSKNPAAVTYEIQNACFAVDLDNIEDLGYWRDEIQPNLPWADDHFAERVGGQPLNPGEEWKRWPWAGSAAKFKTDRFNHTYMERLWPKYARRTPDGRLPHGLSQSRKYPENDSRSRQGIAFSYGDLQDLVELLAKEPHTRQAWIPLFFPEDTGFGDGGRKPCTLGYQILVRDGRASIYYPLRSCDFIRHWRDDCYLAVRLLIWIIDQCRRIGLATWSGIRPGEYAMHMTSLHIFENDRRTLQMKETGPKQGGAHEHERGLRQTVG